MRITNKRIRDAVLNGVSTSGPPSLRSRWARSRYSTPEGLDSAYNEAIKLVQTESERLKTEAGSTSDPVQREFLLAKAELHNPEVRYNHRVGVLDMEQPVFRYMARRDWRAHDMLVLMQRIEQHHVIPDTMPTLNPEAEVKLQFITPTARWLEPGELIANSVCERLPRMHIRDFSALDANEHHYTVVVVNPDVPDLSNDSFKNRLVFAAANVPASLANPNADWERADILTNYESPHPEKNAPAQRLCVWVFRQAERASTPATIERDNFNIRAFADERALTAIGAHMWRVKWDLSTPLIVAKYGFPPGNVYYRARTAKPEEALLHIRERKKWAQL